MRREIFTNERNVAGHLLSNPASMKLSSLILRFAGLLAAFAPMWVSGGGDEVVVVYNSRMPESKALAEYYALRRQVPTNQIFGFDLPTTEEMSRLDFRESLQRPFAKKLEDGNLWHIRSQFVPGTNEQSGKVIWRVVESKIRYAVLCYGVPLKILRDPNLKESVPETLPPQLRERNEAAVDNELTCLPAIEQNLPLAGPLPNPLYTTTNAALLHPTNNILMVTRLDGPTPEIARGLVDKAIEAENDGLWGRAYFDLRGVTEPGLKQGDDWIRGAAEICRHFGIETVVDTNAETFPASFPMSQIAFYAGWYDNDVSGPFARPTVEFMPGAFAYHLHSFSAATLRSTNQHWVGPLLAKGATISMGCVDEPYLQGTPDIGVFFGRFLVYGFTFGEAAYAAQSVLSWQTTVVGDPLYRPFGKPPQQVHQELQRRHSNLVGWSHLRVVNLDLAKGIPVAYMVNYLEEIGTTNQSAVLSEKLGDLYATQGKPSSAVRAYQEALTLNPSPQQRVRLRLTLGEKLAALNRDEEAYQNYQKFLEESPDYPDKFAIYNKLLPLAQKLGRKNDATKYEEQIKLLSPPPPANKL